MCFADLEKAFHRVPCGILWEVLREYGVGGPLLRAVLFLGRVERETDRWIDAAAAGMRSLYQSVVVKRELSRKAQFTLVYVAYIFIETVGPINQFPWCLSAVLTVRLIGSGSRLPHLDCLYHRLPSGKLNPSRVHLNFNDKLGIDQTKTRVGYRQ